MLFHLQTAAVCFNTRVRFPFLPFTLALLATPAFAQNTVGELYASDASVRGSLVLSGTGMKVMSGSQMTAGGSTALLKLARGGEIRICPQTSLAASTSSAGSELLLGINTGAIEAEYVIGPVSDAIMTPDFRLQLAGPGRFHLAIGADSRGNTCVASLDGNASAVIVTELMGTGTYQVRPGVSVVFAAGRLQNAQELTGVCGCPAPREDVALAALPETAADPPVTPVSELPETELHVTMEAPFIYRGDAEEQPFTLAKLESRGSLDLALSLQPTATWQEPSPVESSSKKTRGKQRGFFGKIGSFFSKIFRG